MKRTFILLLLLALAAPAVATTYIVRPDGTGDFPAIQAAINASMDGDTIELTNGVFTGDGNRGIDYLGKAIVVCSQSGNPDSCVVDCQGAGRGFYFHSAEDSNSTLERVTVRNGNDAGIFCSPSSPSLVECTIRDNRAPLGGGIECWESSPRLICCTIANNSAISGGGVGCYDNSSPSLVRCKIIGNSAIDGGGVECYHYSSPSFMYCIISGNSADQWAGGALVGGTCSPSFTYCTFTDNRAGQGGGIYYWGGYSVPPIFSHCTIAGNGQGGVHCDGYSVVVSCTIIAFSEGPGVYFRDAVENQMKYCAVFGNSGGNMAFYADDSSQGPPGIGVIDTTNANGDSCDAFYNIFFDPMFVDTAEGDYHLLAGSPCIDAGDPTLPFDPDSTIADIGAFYFHQLAAEPLAVLIPKAYALHPNWPNPFNSSTMIHYDVPTAGRVSLTIFNLLGQRVATLFDGRQFAGSYTINWSASNLPSGLYLCRMEAAGFAQTRKLLLVK